MSSMCAHCFTDGCCSLAEEMEQLLEEGSLNFGNIPSQQMMEMLMERGRH